MWEVFLKQGQEAYGRSEFEAAEGMVRLALAQAPTDSDKVPCLNTLACVQRALKKPAEALVTWKSALDIVRVIPGHPDLGSILHDLAGTQAVLGQAAEAAATYLECLAVVRHQHAERPQQLSDYLCSVATFYIHCGALAQAVPLLREAADLRQRALGPASMDVARTLISLGDVLYSMGDTQAAAEARERARGVLVMLHGPEDPHVTALMMSQARGMQAARNYGQAREIFQACAGILEKTLGPDHPDLAEALRGEATSHLAEGRPQEAVSLYERALSITEKAHPGPHPQVGMRLCDLARVRQHGGDVAQALTLYQKAVDIFRASLGPANPLTLSALDSQVELLAREKHFTQARQLACETLKLRTDTFGTAHPTVAHGMASLGLTYLLEGDYLGAAGLYEQAMGVWARLPKVPDVARISCIYSWGTAMHGALDYFKAEELYEQALRELEQGFGEGHPLVPHVLANLGALLRTMGRDGQALRMEERARALAAR